MCDRWRCERHPLAIHVHAVQISQISPLLFWPSTVTIHKLQGLTLPRIRLGLVPKEFSCGLTFVTLFRVTSLNGLLFIEKLDWARVKKLGGKFLQLRLEDAARRYEGTHE